MNAFTSRLLPLLCFASLSGGAAASVAVAGGAPLVVPRLQCAGSSPTTISINVQAGETGAPFGFLAEWQPSGVDGGCRKWGRVLTHCYAYFEPKTENSPYAMGPYWQTVVTIGNLDTSNPEITTNCPEALKCGTGYCFRVKALGGKDESVTIPRSPYTADLQCSTDPCGELALGYCSYSPGGFGAPPNGNNPATLLLAPNFPYPVTVCDLTFVDHASIEAYLPHGGQPGPIEGDSAGGSLAGQVLAAKLNMIVFDLGLHAEACCTQTGSHGVSFRNLRLCFGDGLLSGLDGLTVGQAVEAAENALCTGQLPAGVSGFGDLTAIVEQINLNFHGETTCIDNGNLCLPGD